MSQKIKQYTPSDFIRNNVDFVHNQNNTFLNTNPKDNPMSVELISFEPTDFVLKIMDMFGTLGPSILGEIGSASVLSLFTENNIEFDSLEDIKEVIRVGNNKENFKVVLDNGEQYIFDSDHRIIGIYKDNYSIYYNYDVRETQKDVIREKLGLDDNTKVNFVATTTIKGENIQGWKAVEGRSIRQITDIDKAFKVITDYGVDEALLYERKPINLTELEKLLGKKDFEALVGDYVIKPKGAPALAPVSDKRAEYKVSSAKEDFAEEVS